MVRSTKCFLCLHSKNKEEKKHPLFKGSILYSLQVFKRWCKPNLADLWKPTKVWSCINRLPCYHCPTTGNKLPCSTHQRNIPKPSHIPHTGHNHTMEEGRLKMKLKCMFIVQTTTSLYGVLIPKWKHIPGNPRQASCCEPTAFETEREGGREKRREKEREGERGKEKERKEKEREWLLLEQVCGSSARG